MRHYEHLTLSEREEIMCLVREGVPIRGIAAEIGRSPATVSREIGRNGDGGAYRAAEAQGRYEARREACGRRPLLTDGPLFSLVADKFLNEQWSPEQIEGRLRLEGSPLTVSRSTIYRGIRAGLFDGACGGRAKRKLRHRGKRRHAAGEEDPRGRIRISHDIGERPASVDERARPGDWEADTVAGKPRGACLLTLVDLASGYLAGGLSPGKRAAPVAEAMEGALEGRPCRTVTCDQGKEFASHEQVSASTGAEFYFAAPHCPWQRGSNENTNGLLREYFPKGEPLDGVEEEEVQGVYDKINMRPRKRLDYRTPYEVYHGTVLHLI